MMLSEMKQLERLALEAHTCNQSWNDFWPTVANRVRQAEPWNRSKFRRLYERLLALVVSGDCDGMLPIGIGDVVPWEADDAMPVDVAATLARLQPFVQGKLFDTSQPYS